MKSKRATNKKENILGSSIKAIDLFCGVGGLTRGLINSGIDVKLGVDIDPYCKYPYSANNKARFLLKAVEEIDASELKSALTGASLKLMAGCAPCQTFSSYNQKAGPEDKRWWLLLQFARLVKEIDPELVTMENVPGLSSQNVFYQFIERLKEQGYSVSHDIVKCDEYGLPQSRNRLVLLASKLGDIQIIKPYELAKQKKNTVRVAISGLKSLSAGEIDEKDPLHQACVLSETNYRRILASKPGGTWRDWPEELVADCHKKKSGKTYPSVYGRMSWDEPAPTITTQFFGFGNGRFGHPEQNRAISLREGAILQSFPKKYKFTAPGATINKKVIGRLIGNAVPVKLGEVIGASILKHVAEYNASATNTDGELNERNRRGNE